MRLAHIVLAHHRPEQLARLVRRLSGEQEQVLIHIDRRRPIEPFRQALREEPVRWVARHPTPWGGFGLVRAALAGLEAAMAGEPDFICLLSGQDYPIKDAAGRRSALAAGGGDAFLEFRPLPAEGLVDGGGMDRLERYYLRPSRAWSLPNRFVPFVPRRRIPAGLRPHGGRQFWCLPREHAGHLLRFARERPEVVRFFSRSFVADEIFFQTVLLSGPLAERVRNDDLHYMAWEGEGEAHPRTLGSEDLDTLRASADIFARKFDAERDPELLDRVDTELLGL